MAPLTKGFSSDFWASFCLLSQVKLRKRGCRSEMIKVIFGTSLSAETGKFADILNAKDFEAQIGSTVNRL
jgi:hypothetical protein